MLYNHHLHSCCSFDAEYPLTALCEAALAGGITDICLTDHCDLLDEYGEPKCDFSWEKEREQLSLAREQYAGRMRIRKGVELGQATLRPEEARRILSEPGIDFVLGSLHNSPMDRRDYYWIEFRDLEQCRVLSEDYLQELLKLAKTDYFDSLAHLTYPLRYIRGHGGFTEFDFRPFDDLVDEILKSLIERGKALELNTSGYRSNNGEPLPAPYILRRYREMGGELITIGTDAHEPAHVADHLEEGMALLRSCGFRYLTVYEGRRPVQQKL